MELIFDGVKNSRSVKIYASGYDAKAVYYENGEVVDTKTSTSFTADTNSSRKIIMDACDYLK